jgi:hypothetical protein
VSENDWFFDSVKTAASFCILQGSGNRARPNDSVNRAEMLAMIERTASNMQYPACSATVTDPLRAIPTSAVEYTPALAEQYLTSGRLAEGEKALSDELVKNPSNDQLRFGIAAIQLVRGTERLTQSLYKYGAGSRQGSGLAGMIPFMRLPVPANPGPEKISDAQFRGMLEQMGNDLGTVQKTLEGIKDPKVQLPLPFGKIKLDINGDGKVEETETMWNLYGVLNSR